jgi:hypothetical protein
MGMSLALSAASARVVPYWPGRGTEGMILGFAASSGTVVLYHLWPCRRDHHHYCDPIRETSLRCVRQRVILLRVVVGNPLGMKFVN